MAGALVAAAVSDAGVASVFVDGGQSFQIDMRPIIDKLTG
jgi:hypothetical protein